MTVLDMDMDIVNLCDVWPPNTSVSFSRCLHSVCRDVTDKAGLGDFGINIHYSLCGGFVVGQMR